MEHSGRLTEEQQEEVLQYARKNIESFVRDREKIDIDNSDYLDQERGLFVTIKTKDGKLRGCIGRPYPNQTLKEALVDASASATRDPRFPPLSQEELDDIEIEVTVLTEPEEIEVNSLEQARGKIEIGKHGLIIKGNRSSGLLLPQVPVDNDMNLREFLDHTCRKAGLPPGSWKKEDVDVLKFQGQVFTED